MNELIQIHYDNDRPTVLARELHGYLGVKTLYNDWFPRMCEYGFVEGNDFYSFLSKSSGGRPAVDHQLTVEMAKEVCMLQRNEKGKQARQYFIELEKQWNTPEAIFARALKMAERKIGSLTFQVAQQSQLIGELKPKANYVDIILDNKGLVTITQIAKDYGMSGQEMNRLLHQHKVQYYQSGQWLLYSEHHDKGFTHSNTIQITRKDGTPDVKMQTKWTQKGRLFIYELLKKHGVLPLIEVEKAS
nr:MAG TPA: antirepressor protein [Caudoviricetes sp.]